MSAANPETRRPSCASVEAALSARTASRELTTTAAPSRPNSVAIARRIPPLDPVTTATLPPSRRATVRRGEADHLHARRRPPPAHQPRAPGVLRPSPPRQHAGRGERPGPPRAPAPDRSDRPAAGLASYLHDHLDLDRDLKWEGAHPDRRARVLAGIPKRRDQDVGSRVDHPRLLFEVGCAVDHAQELDDARHSIQVPDRLLEAAEAVEDGKLGRLSRGV